MVRTFKSTFPKFMSGELVIGNLCSSAGICKRERFINSSGPRVMRVLFLSATFKASGPSRSYIYSRKIYSSALTSINSVHNCSKTHPITNKHIPPIRSSSSTSSNANKNPNPNPNPNPPLTLSFTPTTQSASSTPMSKTPKLPTPPNNQSHPQNSSAW